jgi:hypothetical protein
MSVASQPMTTEEFLALPDDGVDRELYRGVLKEWPTITREPLHCRVVATLCYLLQTWVSEQPAPRGAAYAGRIGVRLHRDPDTLVGPDLAYVSPEEKDELIENDAFLDGRNRVANPILRGLVAFPEGKV